MAENTAETVLKIAAQLNPMIAAAAGLISLVRDVRKAAIEAGVPEESMPSDREIIGRLLDEADLLGDEKDVMLTWLATLPRKESTT